MQCEGMGIVTPRARFNVSPLQAVATYFNNCRESIQVAFAEALPELFGNGAMEGEHAAA
jgi:hypothetical protein